MKIAIIGSGNVGGALAQRLARANHTIIFGVRDTSHFKGQALLSNPAIKARNVHEAVAASEVIIIAVPVTAVEDTAKELGDVSEKVLIDTTNIFREKPKNYPDGFAALFDITNTQDIAKCFNCMGAENMLHPVINDTSLDMYVAGSSIKAKDICKKLASDIGFAATYDFGDNDTVALLEQFALIWINLALIQNHGRKIAFKLLKA